MTHGQLVRDILCAVSPLGLAWAHNTGALRDKDGRVVRYGLSGSADILASIKGRFVGIECKTGKDRVRPNQSAFGTALTKAGGLYIVARSVDDVIDALKLEGLA